MSKFESFLMPCSTSVISLMLSDEPMKAQGGGATSPLVEQTFVGAANFPCDQAGSGVLQVFNKMHHPRWSDALHVGVVRLNFYFLSPRPK